MKNGRTPEGVRPPVARLSIFKTIGLSFVYILAQESESIFHTNNPNGDFKTDSQPTSIGCEIDADQEHDSREQLGYLVLVNFIDVVVW